MNEKHLLNGTLAMLFVVMAGIDPAYADDPPTLNPVYVTADADPQPAPNEPQFGSDPSPSSSNSSYTYYYDWYPGGYPYPTYNPQYSNPGNNHRFIIPYRGPGSAPKPVAPPTPLPTLQGAQDCSIAGLVQTKHPVSITTGNKTLVEPDLATVGFNAISLTRVYSKESSRAGQFGKSWSSSFDYGLGFTKKSGEYCESYPGVPVFCGTSTADLQYVYFNSPNGARYSYTWNATNNRWDEARTDPLSWIVRRSDGMWVRHVEDDSEEIYDQYGYIQSITDDKGIGWKFTYDQYNYLLTKVSDSYGHNFQFQWDQDKKHVTDVLKNGNTYDRFKYTYNANGYLERVTSDGIIGTYLDRQYLYEDQRFPNGVTGIVINGKRYTVYSYDASGKVAQSGLAGGYETDSFVYNANSTQVTNVNGVVTTYALSNIAGTKKVVSIDRSGVTNCPAAKQNNTYDGIGQLLSSTDWNGNKTTYTYNAHGQLTQKITGISSTSPGNEWIENFTWDVSKNRLVKRETLGSGNISLTTDTYEYYPESDRARNWIKSISRTNHWNSGIAPDTSTVSYTYVFDDNSPFPGRIEVDGPLNGNIDKFQYVYEGGLLKYTIDPLGHTTQYLSDSFGRNIQVLNENGYVNFTYDDLGRLLTSSMSNNGSNNFPQTSYQYNGYGEATKITYPDNTVTVREFDDVGHLLRVTNGDGGDTEEYTYNQLSKITKIIRRYPGGDNNFVKNFEYDDIGRLQYVRGNQGQYVYYDYDQNGNVKLVKDSSGGAKTYTYNSHNQVVTVGNANGSKTQRTYDISGQLSAVDDGAFNSTSFTFDGFGRLLSSASNDSGYRNYEYDEGGRVVSKKLIRNGVVKATNYSYDQGNRVLTVSAESLDEDYAVHQVYKYDNCTNGTGRLCQIDDDSGTTTYSYNGLGLLASQDNVIAPKTIATLKGSSSASTAIAGSYAGLTYSTKWDYDLLGRVTDIQYPGLVNVHYSYDQSRRVASVDVSVAGVVHKIADGIIYKPFGPMAAFEFGNGLVMNREFDTDYRMIAHSVKKDVLSQDILNKTLIYDGVDRFLGQYDSSDQSDQVAYTYDATGRVTSANQPIIGLDTYGYDSNGNRLYHEKYTGVNLGNYQLENYTTTLGTNRLQQVGILNGSVRQFNYDDIGNIVEDTNFNYNGEDRIYRYDGLGRLKAISEKQLVVNDSLLRAQYFYNSNNQRVRKTSTFGNTDFIYSIDGKLLAESGVTISDVPSLGNLPTSRPLKTITSQYIYPIVPGTTASLQRLETGTITSTPATSQYIWLNGEIIAMVRSGLIYFVHNDQIGRPEAITGKLGSIVWRAYNSAFDRVVVTDQINGFNIGFPGQYYDPETKLYYNLNRYYDPTIGRYTQPDKMGLFGGVNPYLYAGNNPLTNTDPNGLFCISDNVISVAAGFAGGAVGSGYSVLLAGKSPGLALAAAAAGGIAGAMVGLSNSDKVPTATKYAASALGGMAAPGGKTEMMAGAFGALFGTSVTDQINGNSGSSVTGDLSGSVAGGFISAVATAVLLGGPVGTSAYIATTGGGVGTFANAAVTNYLGSINSTFGDCGCGK